MKQEPILNNLWGKKKNSRLFAWLEENPHLSIAIYDWLLVRYPELIGCGSSVRTYVRDKKGHYKTLSIIGILRFTMRRSFIMAHPEYRTKPDHSLFSIDYL